MMSTRKQRQVKMKSKTDSMEKSTYRVLVAVPVRNGGDYLNRCLSSIISQSYSEIDIAVFENNSNDSTLEIAESFLERDNRVRIFQSSSDLSALENFKRAWTHAEKNYDFFMLLPHDDFISPNYVEEGLKSLQAKPDALAAAPRVSLVTGGKSRPYDFNTKILDQRNYFTFSRDFSALRFPASWFYSFFRVEAIKIIKEGLSSYPSAWGSDRMAVQLLLLRGKLVFNENMEFFAQTGSGSAGKYMEKKLLRRIKLRINYFSTLFGQVSHFGILKLQQRLAFAFLCWKTAAYDTTFTIRNLLRRST